MGTRDRGGGRGRTASGEDLSPKASFVAGSGDGAGGQASARKSRVVADGSLGPDVAALGDRGTDERS